MENRSGLCVDLLITDATLGEHQAAGQFTGARRTDKLHRGLQGQPAETKAC
jgi:hypothetical protein